MKKVLLFFLVLCFIFYNNSYSFDFKKLHQEADQKTQEQALTALQEDPNSPEKLYLLGLIYLNIHKDKQAQDLFEKILANDPQNVAAQWGVAESLRRQRVLDISKKSLEKIIKETPSFYPAYISLAYIKYLELKFNDSVDLAVKVIKLGKGKVDLSNLTRAYLLVSGGQGMLVNSGGPIAKLIYGPSVLYNLRKASKLQPNSAAVLFALGSFYFLAPQYSGGNKDKAIVYLEKTIKVDPLFADSYVRIAQIYKSQGNEKKFQEYLNKALELDPENELALDFKNQKCNFICMSLQD